MVQKAAARHIRSRCGRSECGSEKDTVWPAERTNEAVKRAPGGQGSRWEESVGRWACAPLNGERDVGAASRAACHASYTILLASQVPTSHRQEFISNHRMLLETEALLKDMDVQGP